MSRLAARRGPDRAAAVTLRGGWPVRLLGAALALAVTDPPAWAPDAGTLLLVAAALAAAYAAAPVVAERPYLRSVRWWALLSRHRNSAFLFGCVAAAALRTPPGWLAACDAALLLAYLLTADALAGGPPRGAAAVAAATGATAVVLLASLVRLDSAPWWSPLLAALALLAAALAVGTALHSRRSR
jgi:hypothetical protein